jgi:hypothetical protein
MSTTSEEWINAFAARLGVESPSDEERNDILSLAAIAAHASERTAAPVACWLVAKAGVNVRDAHAIATTLDLA